MTGGMDRCAVLPPIRNSYVFTSGYLTPINEDTVNLLLKDWAAWCETIRNKAGIANRSPVGRDVYHKTAELSAHKRAYRRTAAFYGCFDRGFVPIDYQVEWTEG